MGGTSDAPPIVVLSKLAYVITSIFLEYLPVTGLHTCLAKANLID